MANTEGIQAATPPAENSVGQSIAVGNDYIAILRHQFYKTAASFRKHIFPDCVQLILRNISDTVVSTIFLEAGLYDADGRVIDTFQHKEIDMKPLSSRAVRIILPERSLAKIKTYNIKVARVNTADVEKIQLRAHEFRTNEDSEEEVRGTVKNLSSTRADAALVASYYNANDESLGGKVIIIRDIEPERIKPFHFKYKPPAGETIKTYNLKVMWDIEELK